MNSYKEYESILNTVIKPEQTEPDNITLEEKYEYIVESVGYDTYMDLNKLGFGYEDLYESNLIQYIERKSNEPDFKDVFGGQISQTVVTALMTHFIKPWVEKDSGIVKYSLLWYILTYGIVESIFKLGKQVLNKEKEVDICVVLASGVVEGFQAWASINVIKFFIKKMGFGKNDISLFDRSLSITIVAQHVRASLFNSINDSVVENILCDASKGSPMSDMIDDISDNIKSVKSYIVELFA